VTIGEFNNSASLITSLNLSLYFIPPPTTITGLIAERIILTAFFISFFSPLEKLSVS